MAKQVKENPTADFMLKHGEKIGMGVVLLLFAFFIWTALGPEPLEANRAPTNMSQKADSAQNNIERTRWADLTDEEGPKAISLDKWLKSVVLSKSAYTTLAIDPPVFPKVDERHDPTLYPPESIELHTGYGPLVYESDSTATSRAAPATGGAGDGGLLGGGTIAAADTENTGQPVPLEVGGIRADRDARIAGARWVIIDALVPADKQRQEYLNRFRDALGYDAARDVPEWLGYEIERRDVTAGENDNWTIVARGQAAQIPEKQEWAETAEEIVATDYLHETMTTPLPPRMLADWGREVTHSKIPLQADLEEMQEQVVEPDDDQPADDPAFPFGLDEDENEKGARISPKESRRLRDGEVEEESVPHYLFRYFDFDVRPGRMYQYRTRLVLKDPNYNIHPKNLAKEVIDRDVKPYRFGEWSPPSPTVEMRLDGRMLVSAGKIFRNEPMATMRVEQFDIRTGEEGTAEVDMQRGSVGDFMMRAPVVVPGPNHLVEKDYIFSTGITVLDITGGERIPGSRDRNLRDPVEVLLLEPNGRLVVQSSASDADEIQRQKDLLDPPEESDLLDGGGSGGVGDILPGFGGR